MSHSVKYLFMSVKEYKPMRFALVGDPRVLEDFKVKAKDPEAHQDTINILVYRGAGMGQSAGAGASNAMHKAGITRGIDFMIGNSSGIPTLWAQLNELEGAEDFYYKRNIENKLFDPTRNPMLDVITLVRMFQEETPVNLEQFRALDQKIIAGFTHWQSGRRYRYDLGRLDNPHLGLVGTEAIPIITGNLAIKIRQDDLWVPGRLVDGWISDPQALHAAFEATPYLNSKTGRLEEFSPQRFLAEGKKINYLFGNPDPFDHRIPEIPRPIENLIRGLVKVGVLPGIWYVMAAFPRKFNQDSQTLKGMTTGEIPLHPNIRVSSFVATENPMDPVCMERNIVYGAQMESENTFTSYL